MENQQPHHFIILIFIFQITVESNLGFHSAAAIAFILMVILLVCMAFLQRIASRKTRV